jgi:hypothetical protein
MSPRVLARCNGTEIVDRGSETWITLKHVPSPVWLFVAALLACITLINGTLQAIFAFTPSGPKHGIFAVVLLGIGFAFIRVGISLRRARNKAEEAPGAPLFILADGALLSAERELLAPIESVRLARTLQVASSSKALTLSWPGGSAVIASGNPFGDSIDECVEAMQRIGLRVA